MRRKDENKHQLLNEEAVRMIVQEGFDGFSMKKLAKAANVSPSTIYIYFENREDLLRKLFAAVSLSQAEAVLRNFDPGMGFREGLWVQWQNRYDYAMNNTIHYHFMEQYKNSPLIIKDREHIEKDFRGIMAAFFANAQKKKAFPKLPAEVLWALIFGPLYAIIDCSLADRGIGNTRFHIGHKTLRAAFDLMISAFPQAKR